MSDRGILWENAAGTAKENFTTTALSIAARRRALPMLLPLAGLEWPDASALPPADALEVRIQHRHAH